MALILLLIFCTFFCDVASAQDEEQEQVTTLQSGDVAPFSGTLFSTVAAARLLIELESSQEACDLRMNEALELQSAETQYLVDIERIKGEFCELRNEEILDIKDGHIDLLNGELKKRNTPAISAWYVGGILTGILATSFGVWAVSQASTAN